nr:protein SCAR3 isoform X1 [Ipomoea trifida]
MPLVRVGVRNEFSLGATELYREADKEDPKAVLDGVAVSGLVGILRQLGDLAEFAAEVFHGLQEQVTITSSRSHKLMARVQRIETALPSLEKSILAQQSHLHFAYTTGSNWHTRIHCEENHFIYSDLPRFIMDSYEECHGPPRLHLLDKFDAGGPGSCLKRYSDPTFFKRASAGSDEAYLEKVLKDKKGRKIKKKRSWQKNREVSRGASSLSNYSSRMESRKFDGQTSPSQRISTNGEAMLKSDLKELSHSFDSIYGSACAEGVSCPSSLMHPDEDKAKEMSSLLKSHHDDSLDYCSFDEKSGDNSVSISLSQEQSDHLSSHATWNKQGQPEEDDSRQSFSNSLQMYSNGSLDSAHPDEKCDVYGDISNGYSEEHNSATWNGKTQPEEDESRLSFSAPLHSNGSLDYDIPDKNNGDACVDIGNGLSEDHSAYILYSVTRDDNARPFELASKESLFSPSQMNQDNGIDFASPDEKIWVVSDESGSDFSQNQTCPSPSFSTLHRKMDTLETTPQKYDDVENVETHSANVCPDAKITAAVTLDSVEQIDMQLERKNQKDTTEFASQDDNILVASNETGSNFSQKQTCPYPSSSTLDRMIDTLETTPQKYNGDENLETHSENAGEDAQITAAVTLDTVDQIDLLLEKMNQKGSVDFASPDEKSWVVSDEIGSDFSQKQTCPIPSCSTSDREMDILEIIHQKCNDNENLETHSANVGTDAQITAAVTRGTVGQIVWLLENKRMQMSNYDDAPFDDIDSETDNFVDALNTIESEPESDLDCQTKKQLDLDSVLKTKVVEDAIPEVIAKYANSPLPNLTSEAGEIPAGKDIFGDYSSAVPSDHDSAACFTLDKVTCEDTFHLNTSECNAHLESPQVSKGTVEPVLAHGNLNENGDVLDSTDVESVSKLSSSVFRENGAGVINKVTCPEPPKPPPEPSGVPSVKFWTNGGLLGLQPSKPPDSVLKAVSQVSTTTQDDTIGTPRQNTDPVDEKHARTCVTENGRKNREESQHSMRYHDNQDGGVFVTKTSSRYSSVDLDARVEKSNHSCHQNSINSPPDSHFNESDTVPSGTVLPVAPDSLRTSTGQENVNNSSRILSLGNRLLVNGFQRKLSLGWENNSNSASSMTSGLSEQKNHCENVAARTFSQKTTDLYGTGSPIMSPSWSPPLGHMKISFQPVDGFETHKLKLRFPDRGTRQESGSDMFPSFQLVPDADIPLHDMSSDSDNDTFCRSSPYASDDCLSHQSESNSEQWESGESSSTKDHEVYDALRRISLTESTSTSFDNRLTTQEELYDSVGGQIPFSEHGFERSPSGYFYDLPILDTLRPPVKQESGNCSTSTSLLERYSPKEPTPPPPSVPPQRWQPMRSLSDMTDGREGSLPKGLNYTVDTKLQAATFLHQPKPAPLNQDQVIEPAFGLKSKRLDLQQIDLQRVASLPANGKEMEEKEDFLHQIRTKSFNLRPTVTAKPTQATGLPTSVNAILEKANAIRQVVGSDGEDDNWSDT